MPARPIILAAALLTGIGLATATPARADWHHDWRGGDWHGDWHRHWWHPWGYRPWVYAAPPPVAYGPPPAYYAPPPPPVYYAPAPGLNLNFSIP
jgi:hypothetical protein